MGKEVKKTKKQLEEEAKLKKEEDKKRREEEKKKKEEEEAHKRMLEEVRLKKLEDERLAEEELNRLKSEESKLETWKRNYEESLDYSLKEMIEDEEWNKYSFCENRYINIRKEKDLNGFIYEFKEKSDSNFIANFKLIEKNLAEDIKTFDHSHMHYYNLNRYLLEGKATKNMKILNYAYHYLSIIQEIERKKIETMSVYFIENFDYCKKIILDERYKKKGEKDRDEDLELSVEYSDDGHNTKLGFWINTSDGKYRETYTKFNIIKMKILGMHKAIVQEKNIIRIFWTKNDIREWMMKEYCPYISISGLYNVDKLIHPEKSALVRKWEIREVIANRYISRETMLSTIKFNYQIELPKNVYVKDLTSVIFAKFNEEYNNWTILQASGYDISFDPVKKMAFFSSNELTSYSILLERKIFFPYVSWYLRCTNKTTAILDLVTPRLKLIFEIGITTSKTNKIDNKPIYTGYVKLINNTEPEFSHIVGKEMRYDELILELRYCGILLTPDENDIINIGYKIKNYDAVDRCVNDIIMACRQYAIKSNDKNPYISQEIVLAKFKPNLEHDFYFFDDEEKDWFEVAWYFNKSVIGKSIKEQGEITFESTTTTARPNFLLLIKDMEMEEIYDNISNVNPAFLINLRNFLVILNIVNLA